MRTDHFIEAALEFAVLLQGRDEGKSFDRVFDIADDSTRLAAHRFVTLANCLTHVYDPAPVAVVDVDETILDDRRHARREREEAEAVNQAN